MCPHSVAAMGPQRRCSGFFPTCHQRDWHRLSKRMKNPVHMEMKLFFFANSRGKEEQNNVISKTYQPHSGGMLFKMF